MKKYVSWRRVSTSKQGKSGLGLEAQSDIINYFVNNDNGVIIQDFEEVYTGKDLSGCKELRKAIELCKANNYTLVVAKTDRFRNVQEALMILDELNGNVMFCDLPNTDRFMLTLFWAIAEREALLISIRTKQALRAKKDRGEQWNTENTVSDKAREVSSSNRREAVMNNECTRRFVKVVNRNSNNLGTKDWNNICNELNEMGVCTPNGKQFNVITAKSRWQWWEKFSQKNNIPINFD